MDLNFEDAFQLYWNPETFKESEGVSLLGHPLGG